MLSLQRTLSLGYLGQHPQRVVLVVASIALGVAVLVATRSLDDSLHQAAKGAINPFTTFADLLVANGQTGVPADLADRLKDAGLPGLGDAQPLVMGRAALIELKDQSVRLIGIQLFNDETSSPDKALRGDNPWGLEYTRTDQLADVGWALFKGAKPVVVGVKLAERMKDLPGGTHDFHLRRVAGELQPVASWGTVRLPGPAKILEDDAVFADIRTAASIIYPQRADYCTQINLRLAPGADAEAVRKEVQQYLKDHGEPGQVQTVQANDAMTDDVTASLELGFSIGGYLALMVGLFLVYNVLSVTVAERRHDIGVLRSVGATRGQIAGLFVGEAVLQGLCGSLLGLPLGYGLAWVVLRPLQQVLSEIFIKLPDVPLSVSTPVMLLALAAGLATALLAALVPALQAADEQPADAVRRAPQTVRPIYVALQAGAAAALAAAGLGAAALRSYLPLRVGSFAVPVTLMGAALVAMPLLTAVAGRVVQPLFRFLLGLQGRLAADNLVRSPGRTGLVVAALAATGGLLLMTAGFTYSSEHAIDEWLDDNIAADLYVTAGSGISQAGFSLPMDPGVGAEVAPGPRQTPAAEGVESVLPVRFHYFPYQGHFLYLLALDSGVLRGQARDRALGGALKNWPRFREPHTCVVSDNFAAQQHVGVGDHVAIPGRATPTIDLEIIGTVLDFSSDRGTILVDRSWYSKEFLDDQVDVFDVYLRPGADARRVQEELTRPGGWADKQAVFVERRDELRDAVTNQLERLYRLAYAQECVVGLVALLGVVSALLISVLQRRRELGLLRAVGASQGQVLRSVLAEAALMGLVGAIIGVGVGLMLEWYVVRFMVFNETGFVFPMLVPWRTLLVVLGGSAAAATAAGLWPAWRATRLRIPEAIAYE